MQPQDAYYSEELGQFLLRVRGHPQRTVDRPDAALLAFLASTYEAAANLAAWERKALERQRAIVRGGW